MLLCAHHNWFSYIIAILKPNLSKQLSKEDPKTKKLFMNTSMNLYHVKENSLYAMLKSDWCVT